MDKIIETQSFPRLKYDITLPFPPSVNTAYRNIQFKTKTGRVIPKTLLSKKAREYTKQVKDIIYGLNLDKENINQDIQVIYIYYPKTKRSFDPANFDKVLSDSLTKAGFYSDDKIIKDIRQVKAEKCLTSCVRCLIKTYDRKSTYEEINNFFNDVDYNKIGNLGI